MGTPVIAHCRCFKAATVHIEIVPIKQFSGPRFPIDQPALVFALLLHRTPGVLSFSFHNSLEKLWYSAGAPLG